MRQSLDVSATLAALLYICCCLVVAASALHHQHHYQQHKHHQQHRELYHSHQQQRPLRQQRQMQATHFIRPLRVQHHLVPTGSVQAVAKGRADVGDGRGLMKKLMMLRNMFQQPQNSNVIIITQPTTTTATATATGTTPTTATTTTGTNTPTTTTTTTRDTRENAAAAAAIDSPSGSAEREPNDDGSMPVPAVLGGTHGIDSKIAVDVTAAVVTPEDADEGGDYAATQQHKRKRIRNKGKQQIANLNKPPMRGVAVHEGAAAEGEAMDVELGGTNDIGGEHAGIPGVNRIANKRKRQRKVNKKTMQNKNANKNGFANNNSQNNNNNKNKLVNNDSAPGGSSAGNTGSIFAMNTNSRIQSLLMNAFRRQTPVVYNH